MPDNAGRGVPPAATTPVLHPFLLALYPVLGLYAHNEDKIPFDALFRPVIVLMIGVYAVYRLLRFVYPTRYKAGAATAILALALFSAWHIMNHAMTLVLPAAAGRSNALYLSLFAVSAFAGVAGAVWWARRAGMAPRLFAALAAAAFGAVYVLADGVFRIPFGRGPAWFMAVFAVVTAALLLWVYFSQRGFRRITISLNGFGLVLLGLSALNVLYNRPDQIPFSPPMPLPEAAEPAERGDAPLPDVYFLVFGGHGRADIHRDMYGYNDSAFLESMTALGFHHVPFSAANYPNTLLSLASCLNMDYLERMYPGGERSVPPHEVTELYHNNRVFDYLRRKGYRLVVTAQGSEILEPRDSVDVIVRPVRALTEFEIVLLESSALAPIAELVHRLFYGSDAELRHVIERGRVYQVLDRVQELSAEPSDAPRFVFSIVPIPEAPFLFGADGEWPGSTLARTYAGRTEITGSLADYRKAYAAQLAFTHELITRMCARIIESSERPAVIVVASAHGPGASLATSAIGAEALRERFLNLMLVRIPEEVRAAETADMDRLTLVNLFRAVFNSVYGAGFPLLPDQAFMLTPGPAYSFERLGPRPAGGD